MCMFGLWFLIFVIKFVDVTFISGSSMIGNTNWISTDNKGELYVKIEIEIKEEITLNNLKYFSYLNSYQMIDQERIRGGSTIVVKSQGKENEFYVYINGSIWRNESFIDITAEIANKNGFYIYWFGIDDDESYCGNSKIYETEWIQYYTNGLYVVIDTTDSGFTEDVYYYASISGNENVHLTHGIDSIYSPTINSFKVYVYYNGEGGITPELANSWGWHVNWFGRLKSELDTGESSSLNWIDDNDYIYTDVDISQAQFDNVPLLALSLYGTHSHFLANGVNSVYNPSSKKFRIYLCCTEGAAEAISLNFKVVWYGIDNIHWTISPWEHYNNEYNNPLIIKPNGLSGNHVYQDVWYRERKEFEYHPRFAPNKITFNSYNQPFIRIGVFYNKNDGDVNYFNDYEGSKHFFSNKGFLRRNYIQVLDRNGFWKTISISALLNKELDQKVTIYNSHHGEPSEHIVFDDDGDGYSLFKAIPGYSTAFLMHIRSDDYIRFYEVVEVKYNVNHLVKNEDGKPPIIISLKNNVIYLISPQKDNNGDIDPGSLTSHIIVSNEVNNVLNLNTAHSGQLNVGKVRKEKSNVYFYLGYTFIIETNREATYMNVTKMNLDTYEVVSGYPHYLCKTYSHSGEQDGHNTPAVVKDSKNTLHWVCGSHQKWHIYRNFTIDGKWSDEIRIGFDYTAQKYNKLTYIGLEIDSKDTLHLVTRAIYDWEVNEINYYYSLKYFRKKANEDWKDVGYMIKPKHQHYSIWYHKLTLDKKDNLYLLYYYYAHGSIGEEVYIAELSEFNIVWNGINSSRSTEFISGYDPVIIYSKDGGDTWEFASTSTMTENIIPIIDNNNNDATFKWNVLFITLGIIIGTLLFLILISCGCIIIIKKRKNNDTAIIRSELELVEIGNLKSEIEEDINLRFFKK